MSKKTHIQKLAESLDFRTETEYFDYCLDSHLNGNLSQCRQLFKDLTKEGRKELLKHINRFTGNNSDGERNVSAAYKFYFELL